MENLRVIVLGASGRTGSQVVKQLVDFPEAQLVAACVSEASSSLGKAVPGHALTFQLLTTDMLSQADVVIDFSLPVGTAQLVELCGSLTTKPGLLIATTGHSSAQLQAIERAATSQRVLLCGNTSLGIAALLGAARAAQLVLGKSFDVQIIETHHKHKRDAPSGTAKMLASALSGLGEERPVPIASIRGGEVIGEHEIRFLGPSEQVSLVHRAENRDLFARGALRLSASLVTRPVGLYSLIEMISETSSLV